MAHLRNTGSAGKRVVVDSFTRALHGLMALCFFMAYITSEAHGWRLVHVTSGYTLAFTVLLRLIWGVTGPRRVQLGPLLRRLPGRAQWQDGLRRMEGSTLLRHLLALSLVVLLLSSLPVLVTGYMTYFGVARTWIEEVHEVTANFMLLAVICHIGSVSLLTVFAPAVHMRPMITGCDSGGGPSLVKHNLVTASLALLILVVGFWLWESWQYAVDPQFLAQPAWLHPVGGFQGEDDD